MTKLKQYFLVAIILLAALYSNYLLVCEASSVSAKPDTLNLTVKPTLQANGSVVWVVFRFGAWTRVAYNMTSAVAPLFVYVYSKTPIVVNNRTCTWGLCLSIGKAGETGKKTIIIKIGRKTYRLVIPLIKSVKEKKVAAKPTVLLETAINWLKENALQAAVIAAASIILAYFLKRKTLLLRPWNGLNMLILFVGSIIIYVVFERWRPGSGNLWIVYVVSEFLSWLIIPLGMKVRLALEDPETLSRVEKEVILYSVGGRWAIAEQSVGAAIRRWRGKHTFLMDARIGEVGKVDFSSLWTVYEEDYDREFKELRLLDAVKTRVRA